MGQRICLEIDEQEVRTLHTRGSPGIRAKDGIFRPHEFIGIGQVEIQETFNDIPGRGRESGSE